MSSPAALAAAAAAAVALLALTAAAGPEQAPEAARVLAALGPLPGNASIEELLRGSFSAVAPEGVPRILGADLAPAALSIASDSWTIVKPGKQTACIDGSEFTFQVMRGDPRKFVFYFMGGGLCWNWKSTSLLPTCLGNIMHQPNTGIFDRSNASNPYRHHTVVHINYCSGDGHLGNTSRDYKFKGASENAVQHGYVNVMAAIEWAKAKPGFLADKLDSLSVMGCSAGGIAVQAWARHLFATFPAASREAVVDSLLGFFPDQAKIWPSFGTCGLPIFSPALRDACLNQKLEIPGMAQEVISSPDFADARYAYISSKADAIQEMFYKLFGLLGPAPLMDVLTYSARRWYMDANEVMIWHQQARKLDLQFFLVDGPYHCFTCTSSWGKQYFMGGPVWTGPLGPKDESSPPSLEHWLGQGRGAGSVCAGTRLALGKEPSLLTNNTYCSAALFGPEPALVHV